MKEIHILGKNVLGFEVEQGYVVDNFLTNEHGFNHSVVKTHLDGKHPMMKNTSSDRTYYFLSGNGVFYVNNKTFTVTEGDTITIPKNTLYSFEGKFDSLLISVPAFNPKDDVVYDGIFQKSSLN